VEAVKRIRALANMEAVDHAIMSPRTVAVKDKQMLVRQTSDMNAPMWLIREAKSPQDGRPPQYAMSDGFERRYQRVHPPRPLLRRAGPNPNHNPTCDCDWRYERVLPIQESWP